MSAKQNTGSLGYSPNAVQCVHLYVVASDTQKGVIILDNQVSFDGLLDSLRFHHFAIKTSYEQYYNLGGHRWSSANAKFLWCCWEHNAPRSSEQGGQTDAASAIQAHSTPSDLVLS